MGKFVIENGILKAYLGTDPVVVVPDGVMHIGGNLNADDKSNPDLRGDLLGYKAFFRNHISRNCICRVQPLKLVLNPLSTANHLKFFLFPITYQFGLVSSTQIATGPVIHQLNL